MSERLCQAPAASELASRQALISILRRAYSGERAAYHAYVGHWKSCWDESERTRIREIAEELYIGLSTVKTHIASLMTKLDARNRVEIAMWAYETGRMNRG